MASAKPAVADIPTFVGPWVQVTSSSAPPVMKPAENPPHSAVRKCIAFRVSELFSGGLLIVHMKKATSATMKPKPIQSSGFIVTVDVDCCGGTSAAFFAAS